MFIGLTEGICIRAWNTILPAIEIAAQRGVTNKLAGAIIVLDPRRSHAAFTMDDASSDLPVLFARTINHPDDDSKYTEIATAKAIVSFRSGLPSCRVQQEYPYWYRSGDTKWGGSTVDPGGLIVAFSGVQAVYDEMIAEWMASTIRAMCRWEMTKPDGVMASNPAFLGR